MKSPFSNYGDLVPELPQGKVRLTLTPEQALVLYEAIQFHVEMLEQAPPDTIPADKVPFILAMLEDIDFNLSGKLHFNEAEPQQGKRVYRART